MHFRYAAGTDVGCVRDHNEDAYRVRADLGLFIVADGMGGHAAGEVAADMAVRIVEEVVEQRTLHGDVAPEEVLREALEIANREVYARARREPERGNMGSTAVVLWVRKGRYAIGHVGDSRICRVRKGHMKLLTHDHSYVQELLDQGTLTPEEAETHPERNVITRAIGTDPTVEADTTGGRVVPGDVFLLCTDGLSGVVDEEDTRAVLRKVRDPEPACEELLRRARDAGGPDNITAVIVRLRPRRRRRMIAVVALCIVLALAVVFGRSRWRERTPPAPDLKPSLEPAKRDTLNTEHLDSTPNDTEEH